MHAHRVNVELIYTNDYRMKRRRVHFSTARVRPGRRLKRIQLHVRRPIVCIPYSTLRQRSISKRLHSNRISTEHLLITVSIRDSYGEQEGGGPEIPRCRTTVRKTKTICDHSDGNKQSHVA